MKYFTKEELEDITKELIDNPTRETLKKLNEKYNNITVDETPVKVVQKEEPPVVVPIKEVKMEEPKLEVPVASTSEKEPIVNPTVNPIPSINVPNVDMPKQETQTPVNEPAIPSFELPKLETPMVNNQSNEVVNFTGNLWETGATNPNNLMQTTDNFNSMPNTMPSAEVPISNGPFFGSSPEPVNNPIPITGTPTNATPTMFGQFEKNYM